MRFHILLVFLLAFLFGSAQKGIVSGKLIDRNTKQPIPYSNVVLFNLNDSIINGSITNDLGEFTIINIPWGKYYLSFQSLTHKELKTDPINLSTSTVQIKLGEIILKESTNLTDEVSIKVERAAVKIEPAKKTFDVAATGADAGGTAIDVLNNLPSVDVDDNGTVSLRGNSNIRVLIDGKPAGVTSDDITLVISQLPANSIETIEVITVPSAKYDPEGVGGIINIILKKEKKKGYRGSSSISYAAIDKVNARVSLSINKKKWGLNTSYSYTDGTYWKKITSDASTLIDDSLTIFNNHRNAINRFPNHNAKLEVSYKVNKITKLNLEGTVKKMFFNNLDSSELYWNYDQKNIIENTRNSNKKGHRLSGGGQFSLVSKFKNGNSINFLSRLKGVNTPKEGYFDEPYLLQKETRVFGAQNIVNQLDLTFPIKKATNDTVNLKYLTIETGLKSAFREFHENYSFFDYSPSLNSYYEQTSFSNDLKYSENVYAIYGLLNLGNKNYKASFGLRSEYSDIISEAAGNKFNKALLNLFPSASIVRSFSETRSLSISYGKRIKRPRGKQLNPIPSYSNPYSIFIGNAELIPEKSHMSEISYLNIAKKTTFNGTVFHQFRDDRLGRLSYTDSITGTSTVEWYNFKFHQTLGLELFANFKAKKWFKINGSSTFYNTWVDGSNFRESYTAEYFGYDLKTNLQFQLAANTNLTITGDYNSARIAVVGTVIPRYGSDISVKQKLWKKKATLSVRLTDVFKTRGFGIDVNTDNWERIVRYRYESQLLWVAFSYSFGQTKFGGKRNFKRTSPNDRSF